MSEQPRQSDGYLLGEGNANTPDPKRMGEVATTAVSDCYKAIESICVSNEQVQAIAKQYSELSKALSDDFRKRAETLQSILENFVKHSSASAQRMTEEREHLKSLRPDGT